MVILEKLIADMQCKKYERQYKDLNSGNPRKERRAQKQILRENQMWSQHDKLKSILHDKLTGGR